MFNGFKFLFTSNAGNKNGSGPDSVGTNYLFTYLLTY